MQLVTRVISMNLRDIKVGDIVTRILAGMPMQLHVSAVADDIIACGPWEFSRKSGAEIDELCGWDEHRSGSYLYHDEIGKSVQIEQEGEV